MNSNTSPLAALYVFTLCFFGEASPAQEPLQLTFGVYTSDMPTDMYRMFKPTLVYLEQSMSASIQKPVKIKLRVFNTYDAARKALVGGEVDFVRFGPSSYILAKQENSSISLLVMEEQEGDFKFKGVIFTRANSGIQSLKDLKGKSFAFGDRDSTIGRYLSQTYLVDAGIYAKDLSKQEFLERHDRVVAAVLSGKFDAGATKESNFVKFKKEGLKELLSFDNVTKPWVARGELDSAVVAAIQENLLKLKDKKILEAIGEKITGFGKTDDQMYEPVRIGMAKSIQFEKGPEEKAISTHNAN